MLPNKTQTENVTSGFKSTFISGRNGDVADRRSIDDSLDGGSNLEAGNFTNPTPSTQPAPGCGSVARPVLDVCCGARMFWFDKADARTLFLDKRREIAVDNSVQGRREIVIAPDIVADFKSLPFADNSFALVVFDPPHTFSGPNGYTAKKYGSLGRNWRDEIAAGFRECFRVLCPSGTLIFKWNEHRVPVSTVLSLTPSKPLFGQKCGKTAKTHWIVFMKEAA